MKISSDQRAVYFDFGRVCVAFHTLFTFNLRRGGRYYTLIVVPFFAFGWHNVKREA